MTNSLWSKDLTDIAEAIKEHPDLPVFFNIPNDELAWDYQYTLHERHCIEICTLWEYGDRTFFDEDELKDQIAADIYDEGIEGDCTVDAESRFKDISSQDCILVYTSA